MKKIITLFILNTFLAFNSLLFAGVGDLAHDFTLIKYDDSSSVTLSQFPEKSFIFTGSAGAEDTVNLSVAAGRAVSVRTTPMMNLSF